METFPRDIQLYVARDGKVPFAQWLNSLKDRKARARIRVRLDRVRLGNLGDHRALGQGLWESRVDSCAWENWGGPCHRNAQSGRESERGGGPPLSVRAWYSIALMGCKSP